MDIFMLNHFCYFFNLRRISYKPITAASFKRNLYKYIFKNRDTFKFLKTQV